MNADNKPILLQIGASPQFSGGDNKIAKKFKLDNSPITVKVHEYRKKPSLIISKSNQSYISMNEKEYHDLASGDEFIKEAFTKIREEILKKYGEIATDEEFVMLPKSDRTRSLEKELEKERKKRRKAKSKQQTEWQPSDDSYDEEEEEIIPVKKQRRKQPPAEAAALAA